MVKVVDKCWLCRDAALCVALVQYMLPLGNMGTPPIVVSGFDDGLIVLLSYTDLCGCVFPLYSSGDIYTGLLACVIVISEF